MRALALIGLLALLQPSHAERLAWVPNPRVASGSWVSDPSRHLSPLTVARIDSIVNALQRERGVEIAVVVIDSTSGLEPSEAALALHRAWGVGSGVEDNGIVFLWVPARRATYVSVGYGLEGVLPDARAGRIQDEAVIPAFRRGDYDSGVLAGVLALAAAAREETESRASVRSSQRREGGGLWRTVVAIGGGIAAALAALFGGLRWRRRRPRTCPQGHGRMRLVEDATDEQFLADPERVEERLRSVDYDVWRCDECGHTIKIPYRRWTSGFQQCPQCKYRTLEKKTRTITAATTSSTGIAHVTENCNSCSYHKEYRKTIPRVSQSTSSSGGRSGGGSSGGGSSFGGGSAGGGGAGRGY